MVTFYLVILSKKQISTEYVLDTVLVVEDIVVHTTNMIPPLETYILAEKGGIKQLITQ